jgi:twinkle protein
MSVVELRPKKLPGLFTLADLPQRPSIAAHAFGSGWWELDRIFKLYHGQFTVVTGIPHHGKSTFVLNVLLKLARDHGIVSYLYAPENEGHLYEKLRGIWSGDDESFDYFASNLCVIQSAVPDHYHDEPQTLDWVLDRAADGIKNHNAEIVVIDPWNELDRARPKDMLLTDYVGECLRLIKQFCRTFPVCVIVVAHPTKAVTETNNEITSLYQIESSAHWYNKCDNGLIVRRSGNSAIVTSAKVRESPAAGKIGECHFSVDPVTGIFTPQTGAVDVGS